jgi:hypothetical protein
LFAIPAVCKPQELELHTEEIDIESFLKDSEREKKE